MKKIAFTGLCATALAVGLSGIAGATEGAPGASSVPSVAFSKWNKAQAQAVPSEHIAMLKSVLPASHGLWANAGLRLGPTSGQVAAGGKVLLRGRVGLEAVAAQDGSACVIGTLAGDPAAAACFASVDESGIAFAGTERGEEGNFLFGLAADGVTDLKVTTDAGATYDVPLVSNAFAWGASANEHPVTAIATWVDGRTVEVDVQAPAG